MKDTRRIIRIAFPILLLAAALLTAALAALLALRRGRETSVSAAAAIPSANAAATLWPTAAPTPSATAAPEPYFTEDVAHPSLEGAALDAGAGVPLFGTVTAGAPLTGVGALIVSDVGEDPAYPVEREVTLDTAAGATAYDVMRADTLEGASLHALLMDTPLTAGRYTLYVTAAVSGEERLFVGELRFTVLGDTWERIQKSDFNGSYEETLAFFSGDTERFLYRYQPVWGRYAVADPAWERAYLSSVDMGVGGEAWRVHTDAVPYYERARGYLGSVHVRVHGTNGDSGVLPLGRLIRGYFGSYNSRKTSSLRWISHHAFGTATDLNADMPPNDNTNANKALIDDEVGKRLVYNGILREDGVDYYDFSYAGSYEGTYLGVPETVINYLLYELAFYRAGFQWGHYYNSTSDGMHFTLTDRLAGRHDLKTGLRKVYQYAE